MIKLRKKKQLIFPSNVFFWLMCTFKSSTSYSQFPQTASVVIRANLPTHWSEINAELQPTPCNRTTWHTSPTPLGICTAAAPVPTALSSNVIQTRPTHPSSPPPEPKGKLADHTSIWAPLRATYGPTHSMHSHTDGDRTKWAASGQGLTQRRHKQHKTDLIVYSPRASFNPSPPLKRTGNGSKALKDEGC